jgi:hypothetical protein
MLISRFEEIKMLDDKTFGEFYSKMSDLRNSMVSLAKTVSDVKFYDLCHNVSKSR